MTAEIMLVIAGLVFALLLTGLFLTMREFMESVEDPALKKGADFNLNSKG